MPASGKAATGEDRHGGDVNASETRCRKVLARLTRTGLEQDEAANTPHWAVVRKSSVREPGACEMPIVPTGDAGEPGGGFAESVWQGKALNNSSC